MISTRWFYGDKDISDAHYIRRTVFIDEQDVSEEEEMDGTDTDAIHVVVYEDGAPVSTARIIFVDGQCLIGRVATLKEKRGQGLGGLAVRMLIRRAFEMGADKQYVHAQTQAQKFYESLGFTAYGELFYEANIPHVSMVHNGDIGGHC